MIRLWLKKDYPHIKTLAKEEGAEIYFGDAAHIRSDHHAGSTWGAEGETPIVRASGARHGMSLLSAITSRGHMRFMIIDSGGVNADVFIEFLKRLLEWRRALTIFFIVDRGPAHRAKKDEACSSKRLGGRLRLFFLPPYCARSQSRRVGLEASEGGHRRPHGCNQSRPTSRRQVRSSMRGLQNDDKKSFPSFKSPRSNMQRKDEHLMD